MTMIVTIGIICFITGTIIGAILTLLIVAEVRMKTEIKKNRGKQ